VGSIPKRQHTYKSLLKINDLVVDSLLEFVRIHELVGFISFNFCEKEGVL
jgi:hypothetical protein